MKHFISTTVMFLLFFSSIEGQGDTTIMPYFAFLDMVRSHHPMAYQAGLLEEKADATRLQARGNFDPKIEAGYDRKSFDDKNYFSVLSSSLKVPTWFGPDIKIGYDRTSGQFLDNSDFLPPRGLWNAGISIPLGKGLIIDQRRAEVKKAQVYTNATQQERRVMLNTLIYQASLAYLDWQEKYNYLQIIAEGIEIADRRFQATKESFINGDKPAVDTLESFISLQNREQSYLKALQDFNNSSILLENFLWIDGYIPLELEPNTFPGNLATSLFQRTIDSLQLQQEAILENHPELLLYQYKLESLEIDNRLNRENLKPDLRISYNPLVGTREDAVFDTWQWDNYKIGATLSYPLLLRKERGKIQLTELKIRDTRYEQSLKRQNIRVKLDNYLNNNFALVDQLDLQEDLVINYRRMLQAENRRFEIGESSVFLVNTRENKYLDSQYKLVSNQVKLIKNRLTYIFLTGQLN